MKAKKDLLRMSEILFWDKAEKKFTFCVCSACSREYKLGAEATLYS